MFLYNMKVNATMFISTLILIICDPKSTLDVFKLRAPVFVSSSLKCEAAWIMDYGSHTLLTDFYQISMTYALWKAGRHEIEAVFELFFRKNPFDGEFTIFAGLNECLKLLQAFSFSADDLKYLKYIMPANTEDAFFKYLASINLAGLTIWAIDEGSPVFPTVPLLIVKGPLAICHLLETPLLNIINYASLVTTNASRIRLAAGDSKRLLEFGLRRAQGPNGGLYGSLFSYIGGFDSTSNVLAGQKYGIPVCGTHAHSFVSSFVDEGNRVTSPSQDSQVGPEVTSRSSGDGGVVDLRDDLRRLSNDWLRRLGESVPQMHPDQIRSSELAAFVSYATAFPRNFVALIDTYSVAKSGLPAFCAVALALHELGYHPIGVRIDSGDLSYLSLYARKMFVNIAHTFNVSWFANLTIIASNDLDEDVIHSLEQQGHSVDVFGVGTSLVTCTKQPALGGVYKLVEIDGHPTAKISEDARKSSIPGHKFAYRFYNSQGESYLCRHAYQATKMVYAEPTVVEQLHGVVWKDNAPTICQVSLKELRRRVNAGIRSLRVDHKRRLNATPYKVSLSERLFNATQATWTKFAPQMVLK